MEAQNPIRKPDQKDAEETIFEAARDVFYEHGFDGARMKEIARRAGLNHSMLHYYYRTKSKLFGAVFRRAVLTLMPPVLDALTAPGPLLLKLETFVGRYLDMIQKNPHMPVFILQELHRNPDALKEVVGVATGGVFDGFRDQVRAAVERGEIRPIAPEHLLANVLALCVFPIVSRPMLQTVMTFDGPEYQTFLRGRKSEVTSFIRNALVP